MIKPEDLKKMTPAQRAALSQKEVNARLQGQMNKPKPIKPGIKPKLNSTKPTRKNAMPAPGSGNNPVTKALKFFLGDQTKPSGKKKPGATKVTPNRKRLPKETPKKNLPLRPGTQSPKVPIRSGPRKPKATAKPAPAEPKKKPTLDDYLLKGKRPPVKIKPGLKRPSDSDVIIKGYNDKKVKGK